MFPSMMIYRLRVLQSERIGEGTILKKEYLSRFSYRSHPLPSSQQYNTNAKFS